MEVRKKKHTKNVPLGVIILRACCGCCPSLSPSRKRILMQASVLLLTFLCYMSYHLARKAPSIVKSTLHTHNNSTDHEKPYGGWAPFNTSKGEGLLGSLDTAFLFSYAVGMFFSGHLGDRLNLRYFLSAGMILTGVFTALFGMAYIWKLHMFWYFVVVQVLCGIVQSTGWPAVVSVVGYWFGKGKRGFIMGVWNAHTSVGNILGSVICSAALAIGWGYSFIIPGGIIGALGVAIFLFLVVTPEDVGLDSPNAVVLLPNHHSGDEEEEENVITETETDSDVGSYGVGYGAVTSGSINPTNKKIKGSGAGDGEGREDTILLSAAKQKKQGINFFRAWMIPGVAEFAMALFFCKLVSYTFLYWLPFYLNHTEIGDDKLSTSESGNLSTLFDVGGIIGGIIAGLISDWLPAQATTSAVMMYISVPALYCYRAFGDHSYALNIVLMLVAGVFVNGPYSLITTAVSADLGTHSSLKGDAKALATVTAIIDGTGSMGAAVGPFITGWLSSTHDGWDRVFWMLMGMCGASALLLSRLLFKELRRCCAGPKEQAYLHDSDLPPKSFSFVDGGLEGGGGGDAPRMTQHQQQPQPQGFLHSPHQYFNQDASAPPMEATSPLYYHASGTSPFERAAFHRTDT